MALINSQLIKKYGKSAFLESDNQPKVSNESRNKSSTQQNESINLFGEKANISINETAS